MSTINRCLLLPVDRVGIASELHPAKSLGFLDVSQMIVYSELYAIKSVQIVCAGPISSVEVLAIPG